MAGAALVVLWSITTRVGPIPVTIPLPYLNSDSRVVEVVVSANSQAGVPIILNVGADQAKPYDLMYEHEFTSVSNNYEIQLVNSEYDEFVPANTLFYMQAYLLSDIPPELLNFEFIGYAVNS